MNFMVRVAAGSFGKSFELRVPLKPNYASEHGGILTADSQSLVAWTAARLARAAPDEAWVRAVFPRLERGMWWYTSLERGELIDQAPFSDWKDSVSARRGAVFFTELLRWQAYRALHELAGMIGDEAAAARWKGRAEAHKDRLEAAFWLEKEGHYRDTLERPLFSTDGNLAAIVWGFSSDEESERILSAMERLDLWTPWGPKAGERYLPSEKGWLVRVAGIPGYHDDFVWLWTAALALLALDRPGHYTRRDALAETPSRQNRRRRRGLRGLPPRVGPPVRSWFYSSEAPSVGAPACSGSL